ncbi:NUDIX domain-containing protein [Listeria booriae]|uniref:NUDIX domain-containing protein n=1 Tax=Listeria booriae TaxID=1552123 RepID=A0A7X0ZVL2_9LIST|nr:NUDIX domain-containing protein [Listeria booriae]MBC1911924.1 NUDIX domain-containing protein [Listeria booriae]MBC2056787.1 NUDIX domain-containing protein [Listeria booriae]MBC2067585.1 NUDIX domain-containing protein [Listeria booriae]MBC2098728.1 NUDIX domain-containing protein [Listeria booriae]MBC2283443.1 NUDIX domain-containing protein [Listeria booriae]
MVEKLKIFNVEHQQIGTASRDDVHHKGLWHETFHCWFVSEDLTEIFIQYRSDKKKDFAGLYDITAAGHLTQDETVLDGIREVKEELGVAVTFDDLVSLGVIATSYVTAGFVDREFCHVFLYKFAGTLADFDLQEEEVGGMVTANLQEFRAFFKGEADALRVRGFKLGVEEPVDEMVGMRQFTLEENNYYGKLIDAMELRGIL